MKKTLLIITTLILMLPLVYIQQVQAATYPGIDSMKPKSANPHTPIDTEIYVEFNSKIVKFDQNKISVRRKQTASTYITEKVKEIKMDGEKLVILLEDDLVFNKNYEVVFEPYAVELQNGFYKSTIKNSFKTNYMSFHTLMVVDKAKLKDLLNSYTPRQLKVSAPERFVDEVMVHHKKKGYANADSNKTITEALTNIDILVKNNGKGVSSILVDIMKGNKRIARNYATKASAQPGKTQAIYSVGFGDLPPSFDVKITVFDSTLYIMDELFVKVASEDTKLFTKVEEKYKYETPGNTYSLHELVTDEKLFNAILTENNIRKVMVQVDK